MLSCISLCWRGQWGFNETKFLVEVSKMKRHRSLQLHVLISAWLKTGCSHHVGVDLIIVYSLYSSLNLLGISSNLRYESEHVFSVRMWDSCAALPRRITMRCNCTNGYMQQFNTDRSRLKLIAVNKRDLRWQRWRPVSTDVEVNLIKNHKEGWTQRRVLGKTSAEVLLRSGFLGLLELCNIWSDLLIGQPKTNH